jgi:hypothetical protein
MNRCDAEAIDTRNTDKADDNECSNNETAATQKPLKQKLAGRGLYLEVL